MPKVVNLNTGLVYRNPMPHLHSRHAYFPSLVELPDGDLVAAMDIGSAFEAVDMRSYVCRSSDGGKTWSPPQMIFEPDVSVHPVSTTCRISRMPDGELVGATCLFDRTRTNKALGNPATEGFVHTQMAIVRSRDAGQTWSLPEPIRPAIDWHHFETCSPVFAAARGRWILPSSIWNDWDGRCPHGEARAIAFVSDDGGRTWPKLASVMDGSRDRITAWEQKMITLSDGRLMALCWCYDYKTKANIWNRYTFSTDNGETFGPPLDTPLHGETCTPVACLTTVFFVSTGVWTSAACGLTWPASRETGGSLCMTARSGA